MSGIESLSLATALGAVGVSFAALIRSHRNAGAVAALDVETTNRLESLERTASVIIADIGHLVGLGACDGLTLPDLQRRLGMLARSAQGNRAVAYDHVQHGTWVRKRGSERIGRVVARVVDGPYVVMWGDPDEQAERTTRTGAWWTEHDRRSWGLCHPDHIDMVPDREPTPWLEPPGEPGWSVAALMAVGGVHQIDVVRWGEPIPLDVPGVYVVALTRDASRCAKTLPFAPLGDRALTRLLQQRPGLRIDGKRPNIDELRDRIGSFWLRDQTVLYVGKAGTSVRTRVGQYYTTPLGARSPHAGGWFLKTLATLDQTFVHFGAVENPESAEHRMLEAFVASIDPAIHKRLPDPELPLPFANLQLPGGRRKRHGITGATGRLARRPSTDV